MYIHLGSDVIIRGKDLVGIFDIERTTTTRRTREFLSAAQKKKQVVTVGEDFPKSFAVCARNGDFTVYLTQLSPATLKKRADTENYA